MKVGTDKATHGLIGRHPFLGRGILNWYDNELEAWRDKKKLETEGATDCKVISYESFINSSDLRIKIIDLIFKK